MNGDERRMKADLSGNCQGNKKPQPDVDRAAVVFKLNLQGLIAAVESNHQAQNEDEQVDVGQVHRQSGGQILVVAVAAG